MTKETWLNLPVKNVSRSMEFFTGIGFSFNMQQSNGTDMACLLVGSKKFVIMLFKDTAFKNIIQGEVSDAGSAGEMMISIDAETPEEVDEMAKKVEAAGGIVFSRPAAVQGWMYGCAFTDPDGHRWNILHMDLSKMPKG